jgi:hypothetical protein
VAPLTILTFLWGSKYSLYYVDRLAAGIRRHLTQPYRFICIHDRGGAGWTADYEHHPLPDPGLAAIPGCFARLRTFSPAWQHQLGIAPGERIVWLDLDLVVTGRLEPLFDRDEDLVILQGANASNPCPFNGSVLMLRAGAHARVWSDFSPAAAKAIPYHSFPDDQGWIAAKVPRAAGWQAGVRSGIYAFAKPGWPKGLSLPAGARIVAFPGGRDPSDYAYLDWIKTHWIAIDDD